MSFLIKPMNGYTAEKAIINKIKFLWEPGRMSSQKVISWFLDVK